LKKGVIIMANINRYNPLNEMVSLREAMDHLFEESIINPRHSNVLNNRGYAANLFETSDGYTLQLPMPGTQPEDVEITVQQEVVYLKWEVKVQIPEGATLHWKGFQSGKYQQSFTLPAPINAERVEAHYSNGILTLQLPKAEHAKARTIKVNSL
jgi:HSP20 family protein